MAQISLGQIRTGQALVYNNEAYVVVDSAHHKKGRGGAVVRTKLKHIANGNVIEATFQGNDKVELADVVRKKVQYLYADDSSMHLMDENYEQFTLDKESVADQLLYLKDGESVDVAFIDGKPATVQLPPKVELLVTEAPPAVKGDTANNATKDVTLETGLHVQAPLFIKDGDVLRINTETGEYVERAT